MTSNNAIKTIESLPIWRGTPVVSTLSGGITNANYRVDDDSGKYVVRLGDDIPEHQVMRFNELAACQAAHAAGLSPKIVHQQPALLVMEYIDSKTLSAEDVCSEHYLPRILQLIKTLHQSGTGKLRGPVLSFWVFHVIRDYAATLQALNSPYCKQLDELLQINQKLESQAGPFEICLCHNDLLPGNILDDGERLWLIDFDYAGFNTPLFDLGGLAANNSLDAKQETWLLENYFEKPVTDQLLGQYHAIKSASLLRETLWSMVSEQTSKIDFDYRQYTAENLQRFREQLTVFEGFSR